jgi:hypothetical protein
MSPVVYRVLGLLCAVVATVPLGTNRSLVYVLWMIVSGQLLATRGAGIPGLRACGLAPPIVRRAWQAVGHGAWTSPALLHAWQATVAAEGQWVPLRADGYRPVAVDVTGFWRPRLRACPTTHYSAEAGRALPAIPVGIIARVGEVDTVPVSVPMAWVRAPGDDASWPAHHRRLLAETARLLAPEECAVVDSGVPLAQVQQAGLTRYVLRLPKHFTARRAAPAPYAGRGRRPTRGVLVRPQERTYRGRTLAATPPDATVTWEEQGHRLRAAVWRELVRPDAPPDGPRFQVVAIWDARYRTPWLLACSLPLAPQAVYRLYRARWAVELLPQTTKQGLGAARQFVSAPETCQRWPELGLLAGAVLQYAAATSPAVPTGFWDRRPQRTPGRLRRVLAGQAFPAEFPWPARFREKRAPTSHLPKGSFGQRHARPRARAAPGHGAVSGDQHVAA